MDLIGWLLVLVGLLVSVGLHELGHMVPAKRFGVKVSQYMIGFGPKIWSFTRGDTEYGVKWILLGGYVRMIGMIPPTEALKGRAAERARSGAPQRWWHRVAEEVRETSAEDIEPGDEDRVFYKLSVPRKLIVMTGGTAMNLLLAIICIGVAVCGIGVSGATNAIGTVSACAVTADDGSCPADSDPSPAQQAGLQSGDRIVEFNGTAIATAAEAQAAVRKAAGVPSQMVVERDGRRVSLDVTPAARETADGTVGSIGIVFAVEQQRESVTALPGQVWDAFTGTVGAVVRLPVETYKVVASMVSGEERDVNGVQSIVGVGRIAGDVVSSEATTSNKAVMVLLLLGSLNMALFVFNLVPLLPMDGGHAAGAVWEGLRRRIARLRGRPDPGPVDVAMSMPIAQAMFVLLIVMGGTLILADIINPVALG